jgi:hypothetical protein
MRRFIPSLFVVLAATACSQQYSPESLASFAKFGGEVSQSNPSPFSVTAVAQDTADGEQLAITLRNTSDKSVTMYEASLPWVYEQLTVAAISTSGKVVRNVYPVIDTFTVKEVTLAPGQALSGSYKLRQRLSLTKELRSSDVLVLWSYKPVVGETTYDKITGVALLSGRKP